MRGRPLLLQPHRAPTVASSAAVPPAAAAERAELAAAGGRAARRLAAHAAAAKDVPTLSETTRSTSSNAGNSTDTDEHTKRALAIFGYGSLVSGVW